MSAKNRHHPTKTKALSRLLDYVNYSSFIKVDELIREWTQRPNKLCARSGVLFKKRVIRLVREWERKINDN